MEPTHQHIAFLCGHFTTKASPSFQTLSSIGWKQFHLPDDVRAIEKRYFYPEFVDFCYSKETGSNCTRFIKHIDEELEITIGERTIPFAVKELTLYMMPFCLALFSIHIELQTSDLNDGTALLSSLRSIDYYSDRHNTFIEKAIVPFLKAYEVLTGKTPTSHSDLIENGNKLRIFQIVNSHDKATAALSEEQKDGLLYELATVTKITKGGEMDDYSASEAYLKKVVERSKVSVFRNWSGLALMDSFTILAFDASERLVGNWSDSYFRMIYIHGLFQKCYLFNLNVRFRRSLPPAPSLEGVEGLWARLRRVCRRQADVGELVEEYEAFQQQCCFHKISYNFLPLEIAEAIDRGLEINEEMNELFSVVEKEKRRRDEANDKTVNTLLTSLSLLTLFSAIWDISCLLDQMYPYADYLGGQTLGYRTVALLLLLAVSFLFFIIYRGRRR